MDDRLLLTKAITLCILETQTTTENDDRSQELYLQVADSIKLPEITNLLDDNLKAVKGLLTLMLNMCHASVPLDINEVLQQIRTIASNDISIYDSIHNAVAEGVSEDARKSLTVSLRRALRNHFRDMSVTSIVNIAAKKLRFDRKSIPNVTRYIAELVTLLEPYVSDMVELDPAVINDVCFDEVGTLEKVYDDIKKDSTGESILRTGWQGVNRMLRGGFRRGDEAMCSALPHNYKTGFTLNIFRQLAMYNKPYMIDSTKKPLLVRISFEDTITNNMKFIFAALKENELKHPLTEEELDSYPSTEIAAYVKEKLTVTGYHIKMLRVDPTRWTYMDICNKLTEYESQGFEIHACMLDYLSMIPTTGCIQGPAGIDQRDLFRRLRNYTNPYKSTPIL